MAEIWYRGEAVGSASQIAKTNPHDFLEEGGLYLSDQRSVAEQYAKTRATDPAAERVYSVSIDPKSMRVLDLTTDPRWAKFMRPAAPGMPNNEDLIRQANENYGRFFRSFLKTEKIDISRYDAIIGHEYVRGGRQMCILYKNGRPGVLASSLRQRFVQIPANQAAMSSQNRSRAIRTIGGGLRAVGGTAAMLGLSILGSWLFQKVNAKVIDQQMRKHEPKILSRLNEEKAAIAEIQVRGSKAYANVTISFLDMDTFVENQAVPLLTMVELTAVNVNDQSIESEPKITYETAILKRVQRTTCTYSFEVGLSEEEVDLYRSYKLELQWYEDQIRGPKIAPQDVLRLSVDKMKLEARLRDALGK